MSKNKPYCTDENWQGRSDCKLCTIRDTVLFSVLKAAELESALLQIDNSWLDAERVLFSQNTQAGYVYTLRAGCVKIVHELEDGSRRIVRLHYPGDVIGLEALLGEPYRNSAVVLQRADLCRIPVSVVQALEQHNPALHQQLIQRWQATLDEAESFITELNTGQSDLRLARLLLKLEANSRNHRIPDLLREDIAAIIGISLETASRLMADFQRRKLVSDVQNRSMCCDTDALKSLL